MSDNEAAIHVAQPNWDYWLNVQVVEVWQAVALACDIEPSSLDAFGGFDPDRFFHNGRRVPHKDIFKRRLSVAERNFNALGVYRTMNDWGKLASQLNVNLNRFVEWALKSLPRPWSDMPQELASLVQESASNVVARPLPQLRHQENEILRVIGEMGHVATALPKWTANGPGVKAAVLEKLISNHFTVLKFNKAWDRLRREKRIKE